MINFDSSWYSNDQLACKLRNDHNTLIPQQFWFKARLQILRTLIYKQTLLWLPHSWSLLFSSLVVGLGFLWITSSKVLWIRSHLFWFPGKVFSPLSLKRSMVIYVPQSSRDLLLLNSVWILDLILNIWFHSRYLKMAFEYSHSHWNYDLISVMARLNGTKVIFFQ